MDDLRTRLHALSEAQLRLLAAWLEVEHSQPSATPSVLRGYVEANATSVTPDALRSALSARLPDYMVPSTFSVLESLPRTAGGKIDRRALPRPKAEVRRPGSPPGSGESAPDEAEAALLEIWRGVLGIDEIGVDDDFFELGGDSILSIRVIARANEAGWKVAPEAFFDNPTITGMIAAATTRPNPEAAELDRATPTGGSGGAETPPTGDDVTTPIPVPLTPINHWFFEHVRLDPGHWNQAVLLEAPASVSERVFEETLAVLLRRHDALRLRFVQAAGPAGPADATGATGSTGSSGAPSGTGSSTDWKAEVAPYGEVASVSVELLDLAATDPSRHAEAVHELEARLHKNLRLDVSPLLRAAYMSRGSGKRPWLLLVLHHLVVDGVSWSLLLEELEHLFGALASDQPASLPSVRTSYATWTNALAAAAVDSSRDWNAAYWTAPRQRPPALPVDFPESSGANTRGDAGVVKIELSAESTRALLRDAPGAYRTQINDLLLAGLLLAFERWTGSTSLWMSVEGHGRENWDVSLDVSRTVGWFTSVYPLLLELPASMPGRPRDLGGVIKSVKEQLRAVPQNGIGHGVLRYLGGDTEVSRTLRTQAEPEVIFNYYGQRGDGYGETANTGNLRLLRDAGPAARSPREPRPCLVEIDSVVDTGIFSAHFAYDAGRYRASTMEALAAAYESALRELVDHCISGEGGVTPSDFPLAGLDQGDLDQISGLLDDDETDDPQ